MPDPKTCDRCGATYVPKITSSLRVEFNSPTCGLEYLDLCPECTAGLYSYCLGQGR